MKKNEKPKENPVSSRKNNTCNSNNRFGFEFLKAPERAPRVDMCSPDFGQLTSAEKLNDQRYRSLVYRTYPNEPTCACPVEPNQAQAQQQQQQQQHHKKKKKTNCNCCPSGRHQPTDEPTKKTNFASSHCTSSNAKNDETSSRFTNSVRMRGGGSGDLKTSFFNSNVGDFTWYNTRFMMPSRLEGGGGTETYPTIGCGKLTQGRHRNNNNFQCNPDSDSIHWDNINPTYLAANKCILRHNEEKTNKPDCSCSAKDHLEAMMKKKGHGVCMKKPCLGTDCLIKAFKDAQDFVDSIGKVPGLAGLGIVESPYFGQPQEPKEIKKAESKAISVNKAPETANQLCNAQNIDNLKNLSLNTASNAFSPAAPKKPALVQEGVTSIPDPSTLPSFKNRKKDEKIEKPKESDNNAALLAQNFNEDAPCGEPKCKSRPKKANAEAENTEQTSTSQDKSAAQKPDKPKAKSHAGPSGDKSTNAKLAPKASKSKTQFVYSFGNSYPASVYGHKNCSLDRSRVPANMGWLWNKTDTIGRLKPRPGWRPGAISTFLRDLMKEAKKGFQQTKRPMSAPSKGKKGKPHKGMSFTGMKKSGAAEEEEEEEIEFPPTLHIHRKDGVYYVTMYPIRPDASEVPRLDEPMNPLQFKIVKSKDSLASSSTASDMEIEFSPPAAVNRLKKKPNVVHIETQVKQQEIIDAFKRHSKDKDKKNSHKNHKRKSK